MNILKSDKCEHKSCVSITFLCTILNVKLWRDKDSYERFRTTIFYFDRLYKSTL